MAAENSVNDTNQATETQKSGDLKGVVLVGIDGSAGSRRAVRHGVLEAQRRGARLHLLYAMIPHYGLTGLHAEPEEEDREESQKSLDEAVQTICERAPELEVTSEVVIEEPSLALVVASHKADLLVLGGRSLSAMRRVLLGSVSTKVISYAACPVLVVHDRDMVLEGDVVAGIAPESGSPNTLRFAFEEAQRRGRPLHIVSARQHNLSATSLLRSLERKSRVEEGIARAAEHTRELVEAQAVNFPDVEYKLDIVKDHAADALIERSQEAAVTVVGSHGKSSDMYGLLGSVSMAVLQEAPAVIVVPEGKRSYA